MAGYYVYDSAATLGTERLGSDGRCIWRGLRTDAGALRRAKRVFKGPFSLFAFTNVYDDRTYRLVYRRDS